MVRTYRVFYAWSREYGDVSDAGEYDIPEAKAVLKLQETLRKEYGVYPRIYGTVLLWCHYWGNSSIYGDFNSLTVYVLKELCNEMKLSIDDVKKIIDESQDVRKIFEILTALRNRVLSKVPEYYRKYGITKIYEYYSVGEDEDVKGVTEEIVGFLVLMLF